MHGAAPGKPRPAHDRRGEPKAGNPEYMQGITEVALALQQSRAAQPAVIPQMNLNISMAMAMVARGWTHPMLTQVQSAGLAF